MATDHQHRARQAVRDASLECARSVVDCTCGGPCFSRTHHAIPSCMAAPPLATLRLPPQFLADHPRTIDSASDAVWYSKGAAAARAGRWGSPKCAGKQELQAWCDQVLVRAPELVYGGHVRTAVLRRPGLILRALRHRRAMTHQVAGSCIRRRSLRAQKEARTRPRAHAPAHSVRALPWATCTETLV